MDPMRKTALVAGALYLITFVTSIPALLLYHDILNNPLYIVGNASNTGVLVGAFLEILCGLAGIGTAVVLFPVIKRQNEAASLGFATARVLEASMIFVGVLSVLSIVTLQEGHTSGADASSLVTTGRSLVALHDWTFLLGPGMMPAVNALCLGYVLYRSRLVPRIIPMIGLVGAPILFASSTATLFGAYDQISAFATLGALPIAAWEFSLGVWLVVKGFTPSPIITTATVPESHEFDRGLVPAIA